MDGLSSELAYLATRIKRLRKWTSERLDIRESASTAATETKLSPNKRKSEAESKSKFVLSVESWNELAIGIDENGSFLAVSPVPEPRGLFARESAKELPLRGKRWATLLEQLAKSESGQSVRRQDLMIEFGYLGASVSRETIAQLRDNADKFRVVQSASKTLTQAIGDLNRQLRSFVCSGDDKKRRNSPLLVEDRYVCSRFTSRYLLRDESGKLRFGGC